MREIVRLELDDYDYIVKSAGCKSVEDFTDFFINQSNPYNGLFIKNRAPYFDVTDAEGTMCLDLVVYEDNKPEDNFFISFCFSDEDFECCASYFRIFGFHKYDLYEKLYNEKLYKIIYDAPLKELIGYYGQ